MKAAGQLSRPHKKEHDDRNKEIRKALKKEKSTRERAIRSEVGIRKARQTPVFIAPMQITHQEAKAPAIGSCISAATRNQVVAFILTVVACFVLVMAGHPLVLDAFAAWAPQGLVDAIAGLSFLTHFASISKGVIDLRDLLYFLLMIGFWLYASAIVIDLKKAD